MSENARKFFSATATPLASIFGSGFLVIVPILAGAVGPYAWLAMIYVCLLAYAMGSVIRLIFETPSHCLRPEQHRIAPLSLNGLQIWPWS